MIKRHASHGKTYQECLEKTEAWAKDRGAKILDVAHWEPFPSGIFAIAWYVEVPES